MRVWPTVVYAMAARKARFPLGSAPSAAGVGVALSLAVSLASGTAFAQAATALDRYEPAPAGDGTFAVPRASVESNLRVSAAFTISYANAPLVLSLYDPSKGENIRAGTVVSRQLAAHLLTSVELARIAKVELDVPFMLAQGGDSPALNQFLDVVPPGMPKAFPSPQGAAMSDVRIGLRLVIMKQRGWIPAASFSLSTWLPSGNEMAYTSTGKLRQAPAITFGGDHGRYAWSLLFGRKIQSDGDGAGLFGGENLGGASFAARFDRLSAHVELFGSTVTGKQPAFGSSALSAELLFGARYTYGPLSAGLMGGPGIGRGIGTPSYRLLATVGASFDVGSHGASTANGNAGQGQTRPVAKPLALAGLTGQEPDRDSDTVPDVMDQCPDVAGDASPTAAKLGCPPDQDGDRIADADDRCPAEPGVPSVDPVKYGCPLDTDGDGIIDNLDACPNEKGERSEDPKKSGCPVSVRVEGTQIVILQEVNFAVGSDVIEASSFPLLEQVASVFQTHPEITRVAIDGHTDNTGASAANITLSQKRAMAVVRWLVDHGVDTRRLEARGFGPRRPIADNKTAEGKAKNRRVEFQILKRSPQGSSAWREGKAQ